jgi:hypothetical protein
MKGVGELFANFLVLHKAWTVMILILLDIREKAVIIEC